ncbi:MAG: acyltransferase family protein [Terrimicrobiaceae bacterium]
MTEPVQKSRIAYLDSLRGLAIVMVILAHYVAPRFDYDGPGYVFSTFGGGGVLLFFILSGYLIYKTRQNIDAVSFLSRRLWKLFPAYIGVCLVAIFLYYFTHKSLPSHREIACNLTMTQDIFGERMFSNVFWTLLIELKFYFFMAIFGSLICRLPSTAIVLFFFLLNCASFAYSGRGSNLLTFFPVFFIGVALYRYQAAQWRKKEGLDFIVTLGFVCAGFLLFLVENKYSNTVFAAGLSMFSLYVLRAQWQAPALNGIGKISYSLYLYHAALGFFLFDWIKWQFGVNDWVSLAVVTPIVLLVSWLSYHYIENPFVRWGKQMETLHGSFNLAKTDPLKNK